MSNLHPDNPSKVYDLGGVGIGPSNLSLAALLTHKVRDIEFAFLDAKPEFRWHPGMLFTEADLQSSFLKDLVTPVDPSNPFSFLCFLAENDRLYQFLNARFPSIKRKEFNQYLSWVSRRLPNLNFNQSVDSIEFDARLQQFFLCTRDRVVRSKNLVLGVGAIPKVPPCASPYLGDSVFHSIEYLKHDVNPSGKRIAVIGGGQSGAEIFHKLISDIHDLPQEIYWISSRPNFLHLDDSPFVNEYYTPRYSDYFYRLSRTERERLISEQTLTSDGITEDLLKDIYRWLYQLKFLEGKGNVAKLVPESRLCDVSRRGDAALNLVIQGKHSITALDVDLVILATGFEYGLPACFSSLDNKLVREDGAVIFGSDFSVQWDGPAENRIYMQNAARLQRGVADPNLALMAWRSAAIANSLAGFSIYKRHESDGLIDWESHLHDLALVANPEVFEKLPA